MGVCLKKTELFEFKLRFLVFKYSPVKEILLHSSIPSSTHPQLCIQIVTQVNIMLSTRTVKSTPLLKT